MNSCQTCFLPRPEMRIRLCMPSLIDELSVSSMNAFTFRLSTKFIQMGSSRAHGSSSKLSRSPTRTLPSTYRPPFLMSLPKSIRGRQLRGLAMSKSICGRQNFTWSLRVSNKSKYLRTQFRDKSNEPSRRKEEYSLAKPDGKLTLD